MENGNQENGVYVCRTQIQRFIFRMPTRRSVVGIVDVVRLSKCSPITITFNQKSNYQEQCLAEHAYPMFAKGEKVIGKISAGTMFTRIFLYRFLRPRKIGKHDLKLHCT
jgi:hypothetical protein